MRPRRWWAAGLLGLLWVGLGQVYVGKAARGIGGFFLVLALSLGAFALLTWGPFPRLALVLFALPAGLSLYLWADAILVAHRSGGSYRRKRYNRWYVYLVLALLAQILGTRVVGFWQAHVSQTFWIPGASMEPTILEGDRLVVDKRSYRFREPGRGDLVVFVAPESESALVLKRVVGLPGERLEIRDKELFLNGRRQPEPYVVHSDPITYGASFGGQGRQRDQVAMTVPPGQYVLLGDNRDASYDSRFYGPIRRESLQGGGRVVIYWSRDPGSGRVRWERIGRVVE